MGMLIENVKVITMNENHDLIDDGYILIENEKIKKVGCGKYTGEKYGISIIDGNGYCALPGLINCHTHAAMTLLRGYGEGLPLMKWLNEKVWPIESKLDEKHIRLGNELAFLEMLRTGTTTFNNMYFMEDKAMEVANEFNIRAVVGVSILGDRWESQLEEAVTLFNKIKNSKNNLVKSIIAPHSPYTLPEEALRVVAKVAENLDSGVHIHIAETSDEINIIREKYNKTPCEFLSQIGILNSKTLAAHCVHLNDNDIKILKDSKVNPVYNPQSNMKLASGVARIADMLQEGINVCLGTDGTSSNNNLNMFEEMESGALLQKLFYRDATKLDGKTMLKMATVNGANALGFKDLGRIKEGYTADLILINMNKPNMVPNHDIYSNVVFSANGSEVEYVIINGKLIMEKGEFTHIDEERIIYQFKNICKELF